jgi:flagellin-specific chaperone FliS
LIIITIISTVARLSANRPIQAKRHKELLVKFDELSKNIESSKKKIIDELNNEIQRARSKNLTGQVQGLIRLLGNYYDSESNDRLLTALTKVDEILGELNAELNDEQSKDKFITYLFSLYATCVCLYCIIQQERIKKIFFIEKGNRSNY